MLGCGRCGLGVNGAQGPDCSSAAVAGWERTNSNTTGKNDDECTTLLDLRMDSINHSFLPSFYYYPLTVSGTIVVVVVTCFMRSKPLSSSLISLTPSLSLSLSLSPSVVPTNNYCHYRKGGKAKKHTNNNQHRSSCARLEPISQISQATPSLSTLNFPQLSLSLPPRTYTSPPPPKRSRSNQR